MMDMYVHCMRGGSHLVHTGHTARAAGAVGHVFLVGHSHGNIIDKKSGR